MAEYTFPATERLKSRTQIQRLFTEGRSIKRFPLRVLYRLDPGNAPYAPLKIMIGVSSKKIPTAPARNRIKRWIREAYRMQRNPLKQALEANNREMHLGFVFLGDRPGDFHTLEKAMKELLEALLNELGPANEL